MPLHDSGFVDALAKCQEIVGNHAINSEIMLWQSKDPSDFSYQLVMHLFITTPEKLKEILVFFT